VPHRAIPCRATPRHATPDPRLASGGEPAWRGAARRGAGTPGGPVAVIGGNVDTRMHRVHLARACDATRWLVSTDARSVTHDRRLRHR